MTKKIEIKYFDETMPKLGSVDKASDEWVDLYTATDIRIKALASGLVGLGIGMRLPDGYEAHIIPRSSLFKKHHVILSNSMGLIDNSYSGDNDEWKANLIAFEDTFIPAHTRILQFRIVPTMKKLGDDIVFETVSKLDDKDRGGFGSTGQN